MKPSQMTEEQRKQFYERLYAMLKDKDHDSRVQGVQEVIQWGGPIPDEFGERYRALLKR